MPEAAAAHTLPPTEVCIDIGERRGLERLPCPDLPEVRYLLRPAMQLGVALLRDLSAGGVGLLLPYPLEPGLTLFLQLPGRAAGATHTRLARVVHATRRLAGGWLVGCRLTPPLSDPDLARLREVLLPASAGSRAGHG